MMRAGAGRNKAAISAIVALLIASPALGQAAAGPPVPAPIKTAIAKPCDPVGPEAGQDAEPIYTGCQIKALGGKLPKLTASPKDPDLSGLYRQGIQGEIVLDLIIAKDGHIRTLSVKTSSRSPELDAIAVALINGGTFSPAADHDGKPVTVRATLPVYFWKDSVTDPAYFKKPCRDFLTDAGWHADHFPEEKPENYRGWLLAKGAVVMIGLRAGGLGAVGKTREFPKTPEYSAVIAACKTMPDKPLFEVMTGK